MSIIAVENIPLKVTLKVLVKTLVRKIRGYFQALGFDTNKKTGLKICYLKLSEKLDPSRVIETINGSTKYTAYVPDKVPKLPSTQKISKHGKIPLKARLALNIAPEETPDSMVIYQVFLATHYEILVELQSKYTGLFNLSKKTGHKLMDSISKTVFERLKKITDSNRDTLQSGFILSKNYRKLHPHFGDFQLILSTLHRLQDAAGAPRTQISESELSAVTQQPALIDNIPYSRVQAACKKYSDRIIKKLTEHVNNLNTDAKSDSEEELARKKVREELKNISKYLPEMVRQVVTHHFIPQKAPFHRMRIYGEPFMPTKEYMLPLTNRHHAVSIMRSDRMYNLLRLNIPLSQYASLMQMDGQMLGGAKLVIRSTDIPLYVIPGYFNRKMKASFGVKTEKNMNVDDSSAKEPCDV